MFIRRSSKVRSEILKFLNAERRPISALELLAYFRKSSKKIKNTNKTSIYRAIKTLITHKDIKEINIGGREKRYELASVLHHHHLICTECGSITDLLMQGDLNDLEKRIKKTKSFKVERHSLEFFGKCKECIA